jgi:hypothetical protein
LDEKRKNLESYIKELEDLKKNFIRISIPLTLIGSITVQSY